MRQVLLRDPQELWATESPLRRLWAGHRTPPRRRAPQHLSVGLGRPSACLAQTPGVTATAPSCGALLSRHPCPGSSDGRQNEGRPPDTRFAFSGKGLRELGYLVTSCARGICPPAPPGTCTEPFSVMGRPAPKGGEWRPRPLPTAPAATTKTAPRQCHVPWRNKRAT